jgi:CHAT domain-containing protein/tetratricopeptide (TPR) repeat protein
MTEAVSPGSGRAGNVVRGPCVAILSLLLLAVAPVDRPPGSPEVRDLLRSGQYRQAELKARALLEEAERVHGDESLEVAELLDQLTEALRREGKAGDPEAMAVCRRALAIKEDVAGLGDPRYAASLFQLGYLHYVNLDLSQARDVLERTLAIQEAALPGDDPAIATTLILLAGILSDAGDSPAAKPLAERALTIRTAALGPDSPEVAEALNVLAGLGIRMGDFSGAIEIQERALRIWEKSRRPDRVATALNNLAAVLYLTGDHSGALASHRRSLTLRIESLGREHELVATSLSGIGLDLAALGDLREARTYLLRAIAIQEKRFGAGSAEVGWTVGQLGMVDMQAGDYAGARPSLERATALLRAGSGEGHPDYAEALAALATTTAALGDAASARAVYERALHVQEAALGSAHPDVGLMLTRYARLLAATGEESLAVETALRGEEISREHLRLTSRSLSERQALAYAAARPSGGRVALSIMADSPGAPPDVVSRVWDSLIRGRMLVLDEMASRHRVVSGSGDPETRRLAGELATARRRLANLLVAGPRGDAPAQYRAAVEKARAAAEQAERSLAGRSAAFERDRERSRLGLREVAAALPPGAALLAYAAAGDSASRAYVAFVLERGDSIPVCVRIGRADGVQAAVSRWLADVSHDARAPGAQPGAAESLSRASGLALRRKIWDPVAPRLRGATHVFVVPEGSVNLVNFAALPSGRDRYLVEEGFVLHQLSAERDLVPETRPAVPGSGLLVIGDPEFDLRLARARSAPGTRGAETGCDPFRSLRFPRLPATGAEARDVAAIWGTRSPSTLLLGPGATEAALKAGSPGTSVIHLATHGFFLDGERRERAVDASRGIGVVSPAPDSAARARPCEGNPLLLSGLALAGANDRVSAMPGQEDGILTAEEISALDLAGVEWVVLSACDTGKGRIQAGEGVVGLRRAFQVAGARAVIVSLWEVEDESAREWMRALYRARIVDGLDAADAVAKADLNVLRGRRAQARSTDPFYWAAFVATGDWR